MRCPRETEASPTQKSSGKVRHSRFSWPALLARKFSVT
jgi:hypothetical protein